MWQRSSLRPSYRVSKPPKVKEEGKRLSLCRLLSDGRAPGADIRIASHCFQRANRQSRAFYAASAGVFSLSLSLSFANSHLAVSGEHLLRIFPFFRALLSPPLSLYSTCMKTTLSIDISFFQFSLSSFNASKMAFFLRPFICRHPRYRG